MRSKNLLRLLLGGTGALALIVSFQNCSKSMTSIDDNMKAQTLATESVFEDGNLSGTAGGKQNSSTSNSDCDGDYCPPAPKPPAPAPQPQPQPQQPAPSPTPQPPAAGQLPDNVPISRVCSSFDGPSSGDKAARVVTASSLKLSVASSSGATLCEDQSTHSIKGEIRAGSLNLKRCLATMSSSKVAAGTYRVKLTNEKGNDVMMDFPAKATVSVSAKGAVTTSWQESGFAGLYYDFNPNLGSDSPGSLGTGTDGAYCQEKASPLFVDMRNLFEKTGAFHLSSLENGILFDIKGERAEPAAFTPYRISWFETQGFAFIALPNAQGEVKGIDQLFGDNTKGPDGQFAANGYKALAKYDDDQDELITDSDEVYGKLRLWFDLNRNGRADAGELMSLKQAGIVTVDLRYDAGFHEVDEHGNEVKFKSVAKLRNGKYRLVFDVWFNLR
ncbi:MAG: hypothetical protein KF802_03325 [Bdellovibrionaceae bacterium]|nr:hypothetical protein [Pseudobdellovibrionaceae bacterium]